MTRRIAPLALGLLLGAASVGPVLAQPPASRAAASVAADEARLQAFLDAEFQRELDFAPQTATIIGRKDHADKWDDQSEAGQLAYLEWRRGSVARLKRQFDRTKLGPEGRMNFDIWSVELERAELRWRFRHQMAPLYSFLYSPHQNLPNFLINTVVVESAADMRGYNARLRALGSAMDTAVARGQAAASVGVRPPRFQVERILAGSRALTAGAPFTEGGKDSALWADAKAKVGQLQTAGKVTAAEADTLLAEARAALLEGMKPGYERLIAYETGQLATAPSGRVGSITLPDGAAYYAAQLKLNTTTELTADEVHKLGLAEVARIQGEQERLARSAGFAGREAYLAELKRIDPPRPFDDATRARLLAVSNAHVARARTLLGPWFGTLPQYRMEVIREPAFSEVAGGAAHAQGASPDGSRPGLVYLHMLGDTPSEAGLASLMCHEAVPGHTMQGDIGVRQKGGPEFRKFTYRYTAFAEGWGLYAEALCKEMGFYENTAQDFMRLDAELFRAARLVVDTGIHAQGWTEDQAVRYLMETGGKQEQQARSETRRYITMPGQATSYKIGMIRIQQARARAEKALGPKFDIKGFHDIVVAAGSLPLTVMDSRIDEWVASRK